MRVQIGGIVTRTLRKRVERLEKAAGGDLENRVRVLAERLGLAPEQILVAAGQQRGRFAKEIDADRQISWGGLCWL
jgi:hypothetical protein